MKCKDLLWKVLRATTNSPNDVWKLRHYERHVGVPKSLLGQPVLRYTVPIKHVANTKYGNIYLVIQFCTDILDFPYFVIDRNALTKDLKADSEYVYAFNVRLCFDYEFEMKNHSRFKTYGEIKEKYRKEILMNSLGLIRDKPRKKIIDKIMWDPGYVKKNKDAFAFIVKKQQFSDDEKEYKGIVKQNKNKKN